jgi:ABC-type branched-subunit amino acid transport system substrate-binding protein
MFMRPGKLFPVLVILAVVAGCGARWSAEEAAQIHARGTRTTVADAEATSTDVATDQVATDGGTTGDVGAPTAGRATTGEPTATGGTTGGTAAKGPLPCSAPSTAPGVSPTELTIGSINTLSGPVPGLGATHLAATQAYVAYRNATGGVCGRKIKLVTGDDGSETPRNRNLVSEMSERGLAMIAGVAAGGDGGLDIIESKQFPVVGTAITPELRASPTYFGVKPDVPAGATIAKYRYLREQGVKTAAVVYIAAASSPEEAHNNERLMEAAGIQVVLDLPMPLSTLSYDSPARAVANSKADYLFFLHDQGGSASMARSLAGTGHQLKFAEYIVAYGSKFIELSGSAAEGSVNFIDTLPVEDGGTVPEQKALIDWMRRTAPTTGIDPFAALGWSGAKALFDTIEKVPGPLSREALLAQLRAVGSYDAGGLLGTIDFSAHRGRGCGVWMVVRGGKWQRLAPAQGFLC